MYGGVAGYHGRFGMLHVYSSFFVLLEPSAQQPKPVQTGPKPAERFHRCVGFGNKERPQPSDVCARPRLALSGSLKLRIPICKEMAYLDMDLDLDMVEAMDLTAASDKRNKG